MCRVLLHLQKHLIKAVGSPYVPSATGGGDGDVDDGGDADDADDADDTGDTGDDVMMMMMMLMTKKISKPEGYLVIFSGLHFSVVCWACAQGRYRSTVASRRVAIGECVLSPL